MVLILTASGSVWSREVSKKRSDRVDERMHVLPRVRDFRHRSVQHEKQRPREPHVFVARRGLLSRRSFELDEKNGDDLPKDGDVVLARLDDSSNDLRWRNGCSPRYRIEAIQSIDESIRVFSSGSQHLCEDSRKDSIDGRERVLPERRLDLGESEEETSRRVDESEESWRDCFWEGGSLEG